MAVSRQTPNMSTSPDLNIEFSIEQTLRLVENFVYEATNSEQSD